MLRLKRPISSQQLIWFSFRAHSCQLAQPDRDLFLYRPTQGPLTPSDFTSLMDLSRRLMAFGASLSDHRATFRMALHTTGPCGPVKQIGPTSCKGSLKYVTEYMKRRT